MITHAKWCRKIRIFCKRNEFVARTSSRIIQSPKTWRRKQSWRNSVWDQAGRKTPEVNRTRKRWFSSRIPFVHECKENPGWWFCIHRDDPDVTRRRQLRGNQFGGKLRFSLPFLAQSNRKESEIIGLPRISWSESNIQKVVHNERFFPLF